MPKALRGLNDHIDAIVETRLKAAGARFKKQPEGIEKVNDVIDAACTEIAKALNPDGFQYAASSRTWLRKSGAFRHRISVQADGGNLSGVHIGLSLHVNVRAPAFKTWRAEKVPGSSCTDYVFASQLGWLLPERSYLKWNLLDPATRGAEVADMVATLRRAALPVFSSFTDKEAFARYLGGLDLDENRPDWVIEEALWLGKVPLAQQVMDRHFARHPEELPAFHAAVADYLRTGEHTAMYAPVDQLAKLAIAFGLLLPA